MANGDMVQPNVPAVPRAPRRLVVFLPAMIFAGLAGLMTVFRVK